MKILVKCNYAKQMIAQLRDLYSKFSGLLFKYFFYSLLCSPLLLKEVIWRVWINEL